jgi:hypothetical protein
MTKLAPDGGDAPSARDAHNLFALAGNFGCVELMNLARSLSVALRSGTRDLTAIRRDIATAADRVALALAQRYAD